MRSLTVDERSLARKENKHYTRRPKHKHEAFSRQSRACNLGKNCDGPQPKRATRIDLKGNKQTPDKISLATFVLLQSAHLIESKTYTFAG